MLGATFRDWSWSFGLSGNDSKKQDNVCVRLYLCRIHAKFVGSILNIA